MKDKKIYMIGNAHLDPVWLWRWQEGFAEIKATFRSALDRMNEFDDFKFTSACSSYYMWVEQSDPAMFREIQQRVKEGRWCIVGGWYLQPDCNLPCGESFARHALVSQRYFREKFGVMAKTGYNVDSFGHNGNLPQILKNSGMDHYIFMRPMKNEKDLPQSLFDWESMDGSRVRTFRIPFFYNMIWEGDMNRFEDVAAMPDATNMMAFYGVGNHGGGPTIALLKKMHENLDDRFLYSTPNEYFESVKEEKVPVVRDDLQFHAKGCYSACSQIKTDNRRAENAILNTEKFSVLSTHLMGTPYPESELDRAWKNIMFNQFHDILGGCSIKEAYTDAKYQHGEALSIADRNTNFALQQISWNIDTTAGKEITPSRDGSLTFANWLSEEHIGTPVVVFNPTGHDVSAVIALRDMPKHISDDAGREVPVQTVRDSKTNVEDKYARAFTAHVPALGYAVYRLYYRTEANESFENPFCCTENSLENEKLRLTFRPDTGELSGLFDKVRGVELLKDATRTILVDETECDTWAHDIAEFKNVVDVCAKGSVKVIEEGPVRATIRATQEIGNSAVIRDYTLTAGSDTVTVKTKVDFHEKHKMMKFSVPVNLTSGEVNCEIPFGFITRPTDGTEQACGSWFSIHEGDCGLGVANDSKYSFDADGSTLSLTVLRGAIFADHFGKRDEFCEYMEQGVHEFTYALFPFRSISDTQRKVEELNNPLTYVVETFHRGPLSTTFRGLSVSEPNIAVTAVKKHVESDAVVVRCYETENRNTDAELEVLGTKFRAQFGHNQIKTFLIKDGTASEVNFLEE